MKQYKGFYIDHVIFNNEAEIDEHIKNSLIEKYKLLNKMFVEDSCMELIVMMQPYADRLHKEFGLEWDEIEAIEIEAMKEVA